MEKSCKNVVKLTLQSITLPLNDQIQTDYIVVEVIMYTFTVY